MTKNKNQNLTMML